MTRILLACGAIIASLAGEASAVTFRVVHSFIGGRDGFNPAAGLTPFHGLLYGTTVFGGSNPCNVQYGCGTLFSVNPATGTVTILHRFGQGTDGVLPDSQLIVVGNTLYGTTLWGGTHGGGGRHRL